MENATNVNSLEERLRVADNLLAENNLEMAGAVLNALKERHPENDEVMTRVDKLAEMRASTAAQKRPATSPGSAPYNDLGIAHYRDNNPEVKWEKQTTIVVLGLVVIGTVAMNAMGVSIAPRRYGSRSRGVVYRVNQDKPSTAQIWERVNNKERLQTQQTR
jgi:hypothetical protein